MEMLDSLEVTMEDSFGSLVTSHLREDSISVEQVKMVPTVHCM